MSKKRLIIFGIILTIFIIGIIYYFMPTTFCKNINNDNGDIFIEIRDGSTGKIKNITNNEDVNEILNIMKNRTYKKQKFSLGYTGTMYTLTIYDGCSKKESFIINSENIIRKDPFFYKLSSKEDELSIMNIIEENLDKIDITSSDFLNNIEYITYGDENQYKIKDAHQIQNIFYMMTMDNFEELNEMPEEFFNMYASSKIPYDGLLDLNIVYTDGSEHHLNILNNTFSYEGEYYCLGCKQKDILDIINGTFTNPYSTYEVDTQVKEINKDSISIMITNNGDKNIEVNEVAYFEYFDNGWYELHQNLNKSKTIVIEKGQSKIIDFSYNIKDIENIEEIHLCRALIMVNQVGNEDEISMYDVNFILNQY